jgi:hypothetical protein
VMLEVFDLFNKITCFVKQNKQVSERQMLHVFSHRQTLDLK